MRVRTFDTIEEAEETFAAAITRCIENGRFDEAQTLITWRTEEREDYVYCG